MPSERKKSTIFPFLLAINASNFVLRTENLQKLSIFLFGFWLKIVPLLGKFPGDAHDCSLYVLVTGLSVESLFVKEAKVHRFNQLNTTAAARQYYFSGIFVADFLKNCRMAKIVLGIDGSEHSARAFHCKYSHKQPVTFGNYGA